MAATTIVGLDIGSTRIRAVEATLTKDRPVINDYGQIALAPSVVVGGVVKDAKAVSATLRQLWAAQAFTTKDVVLGVTHRQVIVREIEIANLPAKELRQALPFLVRDHLPLPVDEALIDFYPLEDVERGHTMRGLMIAAPKEAVIHTVHAVESAGLHVAKVDLSCFAALRASAHLAHDTEALLDLGANATHIIVHTDGVPKIVRTVPQGGEEITGMLATRLGVPAQEAERLKCRAGLLPTAPSPMPSPGETDVERTDVIREALRPLVGEIRSSFNYFSGANPEFPVKRLALVGGGALLPGLADELTRQLGLPVFLSDPLQRVNQVRRGAKHKSGQVDVLGRYRSSAAVSIGLTLGAA